MKKEGRMVMAHMVMEGKGMNGAKKRKEKVGGKLAQGRRRKEEGGATKG